jgi:hypothetical protein
MSARGRPDLTFAAAFLVAWKSGLPRRSQSTCALSRPSEPLNCPRDPIDQLASLSELLSERKRPLTSIPHLMDGRAPDEADPASRSWESRFLSPDHASGSAPGCT